MLAIAYFGNGLALTDNKKYQAALEAFQRVTSVDPSLCPSLALSGFRTI